MVCRNGSDVTFVDTYFYLALLNPRDAAHATVLAASENQSGSLVTTQWVLTEVADALAAPNTRGRFLALLETLKSDPHVSILSADDDLFQRGVALYRNRSDKHWTLTDCFSFVVMQENGISEALTADTHFKQAGFTPLLAES